MKYLKLIKIKVTGDRFFREYYIEWEAEVLITRQREIEDVSFSSMEVFDESGEECKPEADLPLEAIKEEAGNKALEDLQDSDFEDHEEDE